MKSVVAAVALALMIVMPAYSLALADIPDPGNPRYANNILGGFVTPTVAPGQMVLFSFNLTNPYNESAVMKNTTLSIGVYKYSTQETSRTVNDSFKHPPRIDGVGIEVVRDL